MLSDKEFNKASLKYEFEKAYKNKTVITKLMSFRFNILHDWETDDAEYTKDYIIKMFNKMYPEYNITVLCVDNINPNRSTCECYVTCKDLGFVIDHPNALNNLIQNNYLKKIYKGIERGSILVTESKGIVNLSEFNRNIYISLFVTKQNVEFLENIVAKENIILESKNPNMEFRISTDEGINNLIEVTIYLTRKKN